MQEGSKFFRDSKHGAPAFREMLVPGNDFTGNDFTGPHLRRFQFIVGESVKLTQMGRLDDFLAAHARLKKRIHGMRFPIHSRAGRFAMGCIYFSTPIIAGYWIMRSTNAIASRNLGLEGRREKLIEASRKWDNAPRQPSAPSSPH